VDLLFKVAFGIVVLAVVFIAAWFFGSAMEEIDKTIDSRSTV
jgi:hypothetical protein